MRNLIWRALLLAVAATAVEHPFFNITHERLHKRANANPIMGGQNFPDPSVIRTGDGWHAFATNTNINGKLIHVPIAYTRDWKTWTFRGGKDALPKLPAWADARSPRVWAPDVVALSPTSYIMYYSVAAASRPNIHCVSYATSRNVEGPYVDSTTSPWICDFANGGAIDASGYYNAADNTRWVVYKVDGNAVGHGGVCNNGVPPIKSTPILLQQVNVNDGRTKIGSPMQLITNGRADGPVVEAPSLTKMGERYVLFFSSNCYNTPLYDVSYAIANSLKGPYTKYGPLFVTGSGGMTAPGGLDVAVNGDHAMWHANYGKGRASFTGLLSLSGNTIVARAVS